MSEKKEVITIFDSDQNIEEKFGDIEIIINEKIITIVDVPDVIPSNGWLFVGDSNNPDNNGIMIPYKLPELPSIEILEDLTQMNDQMNDIKLIWDELPSESSIAIGSITILCSKIDIDILNLRDNSKLCMYKINALEMF